MYLTMVYGKSDTFFSADAFLNIQKHALEKNGLDLLLFVFLPGYTFECNLYEGKQEVKIILDIEH